jgi:hypothetical protein
MERRVRLASTPEDLRSWCPGASLPLDPPPIAGAQARTHFQRVHGLVERIRARRGGRRAVTGSAAAEPAAPLPQIPTSASDADALPQAPENAR